MSNYFLIMFFGANIMFNALHAQEVKEDFKIINFKTEDGGSIEASLFEGGKELAVIFSHGAIFNKESWYFLCENLQTKGVTSLSLDLRGYGNSKKGSSNNKAFDILGAVEYLKSHGYQHIDLVGGSMGAAAILDALETKTDESLKKAVLLSPAGGNGIVSKNIKKLIIGSKDEAYIARVKEAYDTSAEPKQLKIYEGSYHAQHMFKSSYADELTSLIVDFLMN